MYRRSSNGSTAPRPLGWAPLALTLLAGCGGDSPLVPENPSVAAVVVSPTTVQLAVGDTTRLSAVTRDASGTVLTGRPLTWSAALTSVATVNASGLVTASGAGTTWIRAASGSVSDSSQVTVAAPGPTPSPAPTMTSTEPTSIQAGWSAFTLVVRGTGFSTNSQVRWNQAPLESVVIDGTEIRASVTPAHVQSPGTFDITVTTPTAAGTLTSNALLFTVSERPASSVELRVPGNTLFPGTAVAIDAVARDQFGEIIPDKSIVWSSSDTTVVQVNGGAVHALRNGSVTLRAAASPVSASMTFFVVAPPGADVMYQAEAGGVPELFLKHFTPGGTVRRLRAPGLEGGHAAATNDGSTIAFVSTEGGDSDIYTMNRDGSGLTRITAEAGIDDQPAWSPDGARIAFRSFRDGKSDIWVMRADGSEATNLTFAAVFFPEEYNASPSWSPDGSRIAFSRGFGLGQSIVTISSDGSDLVELVPATANWDRLEPAWSPNGQLLAVESRSRTTGVSQIDFYSAATGEASTFLAGPSNDARTPVWLNDEWMAVTARSLPASSLQTLVVFRVGTGNAVVPLGAASGEVLLPARLQR